MKFFAALCLLLGLVTTFSAAGTVADAGVDETVAYLIKYTAESKLTFIRNGSEHTAPEAADLMRKKYNYAKSEVHSPEDFIRLAASKSHLSGKPYLVKFPDGKTVPSSEWLTEALKAHRAAPAK